MTMQLFLLNLGLNILTQAIPIGFAVYLAVRMGNKTKSPENPSTELNELKDLVDKLTKLNK